jgi:Tfp pilus assembly protein PilE
MGNQQILMIVLGMIIVGIAISIGIILVQEQSVASNRDAMSTDLMNIAVRAQQYYNTPTRMGGGGGTFIGLTADAAGMEKLVSQTTSDNGNGTYSIRTAGNSVRVIIQSVGKVELIDGTNPIMICTVTQGSAMVEIEN